MKLQPITDDLLALLRRIRSPFWNAYDFGYHRSAFKLPGDYSHRLACFKSWTRQELSFYPRQARWSIFVFYKPLKVTAALLSNRLKDFKESVEAWLPIFSEEKISAMLERCLEHYISALAPARPGVMRRST